jgi:hypothetical protein
MPMMLDALRRAALPRIAILLSIVAAVAGGPGASVAVEHDAAVRALLADMRLAIQASGAAGGAFASDGLPRIAVTREADGAPSYRVDLPGVRMAVSANDIWHLGDVRLTLEELGNGPQAIAIRLPATIDVLNPADVLRSRIETGSQALAVTWSPAILGFERISALVEDVGHAGSSGDLIWRAASLRVDSVTERTPPGLWRQRSRVALDDIEIARPVGTLTRAKSFEATLETRDLHLEELADVIREIAELVPPQGEDFAFELGRGIRARPDLRPGAARMGVRIEGMTSTAVSAGALAVDAFIANVELDSLSQSVGTVRIEIDFDGLKLPPSLTTLLGDPAVADGLLPRSATIRATAANLPIRDLRAAYLAGNAGQGNPHAGAGVFIIPRGLAATLDEAQTSVRFEEVRLDSGLVVLAGEGALSVDPAAALGVVGSASLTVWGLDAFQRSLLNAPSLSTLQALGIVGILRALGETDEDDGGLAHTFDIELTAAGRLLVNGQDLSLLLTNL